MAHGALLAWFTVCFQVVQFAITCLIGVYVWQSNKHKASNTRITDLEARFDERLDAHANRLTHLESEIGHLPGHNEMGRIFARLDELHGELSELTGKVGGMCRIVDLINEYFVNRKQ